MLRNLKTLQYNVLAQEVEDFLPQAVTKKKVIYQIL